MIKVKPRRGARYMKHTILPVVSLALTLNETEGERDHSVFTLGTHKKGKGVLLISSLTCGLGKEASHRFPSEWVTSGSCLEGLSWYSLQT